MIPIRKLRAAWLLAAVATVALSWTACASFSSDEPAVSKEDGGGDAPTDGFMPQPDVSVADAGPVGDAHISIDGALIDDSFEEGGTCNGWMLLNGANTYPVAGGHTGKRACLVCGTIYAAISKHVLAPGGGGIYQAFAFVRAPEQDASSATRMTISAVGPDGGTGAGTGTRTPTAQWERLQAVASDVTAATNSIDLGFILDTEGCALIDDVSLTKE